MKHRFFAAAWLTVLLCAAPAVTAYADEETTAAAGWQTREDGRRCYVLDADGTLATGETEIDGVLYYFAKNGAQKLGWQTVGGKRYYYGADGEPQFGFVEWRGETYYVTEALGKLTETAETEEGIRYFDSYGVMRRGMFAEDGKWLFADDTGALSGGEYEIDGMPYLFDESGALLTGWQTASDGLTRYYDPETAEILKGWLKLDGAEYYADKETGGRFTGIHAISSRSYCFDDDGVLQIGMFIYDGVRMYSDSHGALTGGEYREGGIPYLFDSNGAMLTGFQTASDGITRYYDAETASVKTGWITLDGSRYYLSESFTAVTGLQTIDGKHYYFDENGVLQTGLLELDGVRYLAGEDGAFLTGWQTVDDTEYYFTADGAMATAPVVTEDGVLLFDSEGKLTGEGWYIDAAGSIYYCESFGKAVTGSYTVNNTAYTFGEDGKLRSTFVTINGDIRLVDAEGKKVTGWYSAPTGEKYCLTVEGIVLTGWHTIGTNMYYFSASGVMAVSTTVDGFTIDANGIARTANAIAADAALAGYGTQTAYNVYANFVSNYRYVNIEATRTYQQLKTAGWESLITYLLANRRGVCYYLAATLDYFYQRMGLTTRMVHATHSTGDHYWVQVLVNGTWLNYDPTYKNRNGITLSDIIARGAYTIYGYIDVIYDRRGAYVSETYTANA